MELEQSQPKEELASLDGESNDKVSVAYPEHLYYDNGQFIC